MKVQTVIFENNVCETLELMYRYKKNPVKTTEFSAELLPETQLSTDTYLNLFDCIKWKSLTGIEKWKIVFYAKGQGLFSLNCSTDKFINVIFQKKIENNVLTKYEIEFDTPEEGYVFFSVQAFNEFYLENASYFTNQRFQMNLVHLQIITCSYKRNAELFRNISLLKKSLFFDPHSRIYGKLTVQIVDNASQINYKGEEFINISHNINNGGSGGFSKGILLTRELEKDIPISHVVFMDDDVEFILETFYRLYALLCCLKEEYQSEVIAGRMFRADDKVIQYTASEIWNKGDLIHCGYACDVTDRKNLYEINENDNAEYAGWWFACYPMYFVRHNDPEPYFLHCDDVEYGLRHGGTPIILNGIQVWHETYEYRQTPIIAYYDLRNSLAVNQKYGFLNKEQYHKTLENWRKLVSDAHCVRDYAKEFLLIKALNDFMMNMYGKNISDIATYHQKLLKIKGSRFKNIIFRRWVELKYRRKYL